MFSTKVKWIRFAVSTTELDSRLGIRRSVPMVVNGKGVLLIKDQGKFFLVKNRCPHQGIKLDGATCEDGKIICPWHHYGFDLETGRGAGLYLENYPIEERKDGIYAGFEYFSWFG